MEINAIKGRFLKGKLVGEKSYIFTLQEKDMKRISKGVDRAMVYNALKSKYHHRKLAPLLIDEFLILDEDEYAKHVPVVYLHEITAHDKQEYLKKQSKK